MFKQFYKLALCLVLIIVFSSCQNSNTNENINSKSDTGSNTPFDSTKENVYLLETPELSTLKDYITKGNVESVHNHVDVKIPQVALKSEDAKYFNEQMQGFADVLVKKYENYKKEGEHWDFNCDYRYYQNEDVLSIIFYRYYPFKPKAPKDFEDTSVDGLITINFNLKTGALMSDEEFLNFFKIDDLEGKLLSFIHQEYKSLLDEHLKDSTQWREKRMVYTNYSYNTGTSNTNLWRAIHHLKDRPYNLIDTINYHPSGVEFWLITDRQEIARKPCLFYHGESKSPSALVKLSSAIMNGYFYKAADLNQLESKQMQLNPVYEYYAKKLGLEIDASSPLLLSASLGLIKDELFKQRLQGAVNHANLDLISLQARNYDDHRLQTQKTGFSNEVFLLIPKYLDESLNLARIQKEENDEISIDTEDNFIGNILINSNPGKMTPNCEVEVNFKDQLIIYRPQIDPKTGKNIVVEGVMDISDLLEQEKVRKEEVQEDVNNVFQLIIKDW